MNLLLKQNSEQIYMESKSITLYPYHSQAIIVVFIYGTNITYQTIFTKLLMLSAWNLQFFFFVATILYLIRGKIKLQRNDFAICVIDIGIVFVGGRRLHIMHKFESWFFGILSVVAILVNAIGLLAFLFPLFINPYQRVDTFEKLANINPPVYIASTLHAEVRIINTMLKFVDFI